MKEITYTMREDGLMYPDLTISEKKIELGPFAMKRKSFLQQHRRSLFALLVMKGQLNEHLAEIEQRAMDMLEKLTEQMAQTLKLSDAQLQAVYELNLANAIEQVKQMEEQRKRQQAREAATDEAMKKILDESQYKKWAKQKKQQQQNRMNRGMMGGPGGMGRGGMNGGFGGDHSGFGGQGGFGGGFDNGLGF